VEGYAITALESPRASITTLARHFGVDAVETEGMIRFAMRGRAAVASVAPDDLVAAREGDVIELTAAAQTADWGAPLGPGDTLDIRIYQFSAIVGWGAPKTATLTF
jgi:hypothetical protein